MEPEAEKKQQHSNNDITKRGLIDRLVIKLWLFMHLSEKFECIIESAECDYIFKFVKIFYLCR